MQKPSVDLKWHLKMQYMEYITGIRASSDLEWLCIANSIEFDEAYIRLLRLKLSMVNRFDGAKEYAPINPEYAMYVNTGIRPSTLNRIKELMS